MQKTMCYHCGEFVTVGSFELAKTEYNVVSYIFLCSDCKEEEKSMSEGMRPPLQFSEDGLPLISMATCASVNGMLKNEHITPQIFLHLPEQGTIGKVKSIVPSKNPGHVMAQVSYYKEHVRVVFGKEVKERTQEETTVEVVSDFTFAFRLI